MPFCRGCGQPFQWGFCDGAWVPLEPVSTHNDLDRTYVDENGELRADHRDRHEYGETVNVTRLERTVKAGDVQSESPGELVAHDVGEAQDALADEKGWFTKMRGK